MTTSRDPPGGTLLSRVLAEPLATCRAVIEQFRRAPTPPVSKRNIRGGIEPVTVLDLQVQDLLTGALHKGFPGLPVIAEERLTVLPHNPPDCLLVDPIDGTGPLLAGEPYFAVAACLVRHGRAVQAVIDLPAFDVRVTATEGCLHASGDLAGLPVFRGSDILTSPRQEDHLTRFLRQAGLPVLRARPVPTASIKMLLVALRRASAAIYLPHLDGAAPWDYAAAALAVATAGGIVHDDTGRDLARTLPAQISGWAATSAGTNLPTLEILARFPPQET